MNLKKAQESADRHVSAKGANPKKKIVPLREAVSGAMRSSSVNLDHR